MTTVTPISEQLNIDKEFQRLKSSLNLPTPAFAASSRPNAPQVYRMAATLENLRCVLEDGSRSHHVVHISCHCMTTNDEANGSNNNHSVLLFEDADGGAHNISTTTLNKVFCEHARPKSVKLVQLCKGLAVTLKIFCIVFRKKY